MEEQNTPQQDSTGNGGNVSTTVDVAGILAGLGGIIGEFNNKPEETQLGIAQANAAAAQANANAMGNNPNAPQKNNTLLYVGIGVVLLVVIFLLMKMKKS